MGIYFSTSQIPEMASLSSTQRRFVKERCFFWLFYRFGYRAGSIAITVGSIILAFYAADTLKWGIWKGAALACAVLLAFDQLYDAIWIAHWRPEVARFIQLHAQEIETAA